RRPLRPDQRQYGTPHGAQPVGRTDAEGRQEPRGPPRAGASRPRSLASDPHCLRPLRARRPSARRGSRNPQGGSRPPAIGAEEAVRIIAGEWRGRQLRAPEGDTTRPTADRTRETLFSMLASRLGSFEGLAVMDLFAGSGALGLEALSR